MIVVTILGIVTPFLQKCWLMQDSGVCGTLDLGPLSPDAPAFVPGAFLALGGSSQPNNSSFEDTDDEDLIDEHYGYEYDRKNVGYTEDGEYAEYKEVGDYAEADEHHEDWTGNQLGKDGAPSEPLGDHYLNNEAFVPDGAEMQYFDYPSTPEQGFEYVADAEYMYNQPGPSSPCWPYFSSLESECSEAAKPYDYSTIFLNPCPKMMDPYGGFSMPGAFVQQFPAFGSAGYSGVQGPAAYADRRFGISLRPYFDALTIQLSKLPVDISPEQKEQIDALFRNYLLKFSVNGQASNAAERFVRRELVVAFFCPEDIDLGEFLPEQAWLFRLQEKYPYYFCLANNLHAIYNDANLLIDPSSPYAIKSLGSLFLDAAQTAMQLLEPEKFSQNVAQDIYWAHILFHWTSIVTSDPYYSRYGRGELPQFLANPSALKLEALRLVIDGVAKSQLPLSSSVTLGSEEASSLKAFVVRQGIDDHRLASLFNSYGIHHDFFDRVRTYFAVNTRVFESYAKLYQEMIKVTEDTGSFSAFLKYVKLFPMFLDYVSNISNSSFIEFLRYLGTSYLTSTYGDKPVTSLQELLKLSFLFQITLDNYTQDFWKNLAMYEGFLGNNDHPTVYCSSAPSTPRPKTLATRPDKPLEKTRSQIPRSRSQTTLRPTPSPSTPARTFAAEQQPVITRRKKRTRPAKKKATNPVSLGKSNSQVTIKRKAVEVPKTLTSSSNLGASEPGDFAESSCLGTAKQQQSDAIGIEALKNTSSVSNVDGAYGQLENNEKRADEHSYDYDAKSRHLDKEEKSIDTACESGIAVVDKVQGDDSSQRANTDRMQDEVSVKGSVVSIRDDTFLQTDVPPEANINFGSNVDLVAADKIETFDENAVKIETDILVPNPGVDVDPAIAAIPLPSPPETMAQLHASIGTQSALDTRIESALPAPSNSDQSSRLIQETKLDKFIAAVSPRNSRQGIFEAEFDDCSSVFPPSQVDTSFSKPTFLNADSKAPNSPSSIGSDLIHETACCSSNVKQKLPGSPCLPSSDVVKSFEANVLSQPQQESEVDHPTLSKEAFEVLSRESFIEQCYKRYNDKYLPMFNNQEFFGSSFEAFSSLILSIVMRSPGLESLKHIDSVLTYYIYERCRELLKDAGAKLQGLDAKVTEMREKNTLRYLRQPGKITYGINPIGPINVDRMVIIANFLN